MILIIVSEEFSFSSLFFPFVSLLIHTHTYDFEIFTTLDGKKKLTVTPNIYRGAVGGKCVRTKVEY